VSESTGASAGANESGQAKESYWSLEKEDELRRRVAAGEAYADVVMALSARDDRAVHRLKAMRIAQAFHESYERLAPEHGYETREASAVAWENVPARNKALMIATVLDLITRGEIA